MAGPAGVPAVSCLMDAAMWLLDTPTGHPLQPLSGSSDNPHPHFLKDGFWHCISSLVGVVWAASGDPHGLLGK